MPGSIAFVPPRYGPTVVGGAESVIATTARGFASRGWEVEVLTTCARDHYTWANEFPAGVETDGPLTIRRFRTVVDHKARDRARVSQQILTGQSVSIQDQQLWMNDGFRCPELWHYLLDNSDTYQAIVLGPYMFWTTFACGQIDPEKTILMPCLHDEPTAYLDLFQPLISGAAGLWFLTDPERDLARRVFELPMNQSVVGAGVTVPQEYRPDRFRDEFGIDRPFAFFAGRREPGKGWEELRNAFASGVSQGVDLDLVTAGVGDPQVPDDLGQRIHDVGFVTDQQRNDAMAAASVYVQPSEMESFSLTVMEAWLAGTPVVANAASEVVSWHVERSQAGLTYRSASELIECLRFAAAQPAIAAALAIPGRSYVLDNYAPDAVLDRMERTVTTWLRAVEGDPAR